jgi:hypothetical protein
MSEDLLPQPNRNWNKSSTFQGKDVSTLKDSPKDYYSEFL